MITGINPQGGSLGQKSENSKNTPKHTFTPKLLSQNTKEAKIIYEITLKPHFLFRYPPKIPKNTINIPIRLICEKPPALEINEQNEQIINK